MLILALPSLAFSDEKAADGSEWYPFSFSEHLDPNSPANMGRLVLDAPAGKHGFVQAKDGHFYFEDGIRAKFWGTNLTFNANFPDKKQAEILADRIAFFGFNAVRLHHMDFYFEPSGIFEDKDPAFKNPQMKKTGHLSKKQLDWLDYLIYQLKQRGIYVDMNLLVSRHFTLADGVKDADKLDMAAKPASMFDPKLIELQKQYAKDLLTHFNPYTKLRYRDDPAIALIEITNENSILEYWQNNKLNGDFMEFKQDPIPEYYTQQLDRRWNEWLKQKYSTIEKLKDSWGLVKNEQSSPPAPPIPFQPDAWSVEQHQGAELTLKSENNATILTVETITDTPWHLQFRTDHIQLAPGKQYLFKFTASANRPLNIAAVSQQAFPPWENLGLSNEVSLSKSPQTFQIPFVATQDCSNAKLGFIVGFSKGQITIKDMELSQAKDLPDVPSEKDLQQFQFTRPLFKLLSIYNPREQEDIKQFYISLEKEYLDHIKSFLTTTCGVKVPVTGIGGHSVQSQQDMDFIDSHAYWDHPQFPHNAWDMNDFAIHNKSLLQDKDLGIINNLIKAGGEAKQTGKPFTVTEWNHCFPSRYAYETPVLLAAQASEHDWDGLFEFEFSGGWKVTPELRHIQSYFDSLANPQKLILNSIASRLYLNTPGMESKIENGVFYLNSSQTAGAAGKIKGLLLNLGPLNATADKDGAVFLYSADEKPIAETSRLILVTLGDVANSNSGWTNNHFEWGQGPTRLEDIGTRIILDGNKTWKIYGLTPEGQRGKEIPTAVLNGQPTLTTKNLNIPWMELVPADKQN